jgi:excisionase family DNA binding protein
MADRDDYSNYDKGLKEPLAFSIVEAAELAGSSRSVIYEALERGDLKAKKVGRRTVILKEALGSYLSALPDYPSSRRGAKDA